MVPMRRGWSVPAPIKANEPFCLPPFGPMAVEGPGTVHVASQSGRPITRLGADQCLRRRCVMSSVSRCRSSSRQWVRAPQPSLQRLFPMKGDWGHRVAVPQHSGGKARHRHDKEADYPAFCNQSHSASAGCRGVPLHAGSKTSGDFFRTRRSWRHGTAGS